jgi:hypothetical protein
MLDSTDPDGVRGVATPPQHTLYVLASKSGGTIEAHHAGRSLPADARGGRRGALGGSLRRDHRRRHRSGEARAPNVQQAKDATAELPGTCHPDRRRQGTRSAGRAAGKPAVERAWRGGLLRAARVSTGRLRSARRSGGAAA